MRQAVKGHSENTVVILNDTLIAWKSTAASAWGEYKLSTATMQREMKQ